jgi:hypothetical protein
MVMTSSSLMSSPFSSLKQWSPNCSCAAKNLLVIGNGNGAFAAEVLQQCVAAVQQPARTQPSCLMSNSGQLTATVMRSN